MVFGSMFAGYVFCVSHAHHLPVLRAYRKDKKELTVAFTCPSSSLWQKESECVWVEQHQGIAGGKINDSTATEPQRNTVMYAQEANHRKSVCDMFLFVVQVSPLTNSVSPFLTSSTPSESPKQQQQRQQQQGQRANNPPLDPTPTP